MIVSARLRRYAVAAAGLVPGIGVNPFALAAEEAAPPIQRQVDTALHSVLLIAGLLLVLILVAVAVMVWRKVISSPRAAAPEAAADSLALAEAEKKRGNFIAAAGHYDAAGEKIQAGACWEQVKDLTRAAECYEAGGDFNRAAGLYVRAGGSLRAAGLYMRTNNYLEAAKIFRNKGDHLRAAQALELDGKKLAAAREYLTAGNHEHAARLFEEEGMYAEAAAAFQPLLGQVAVTSENADRHVAYAAILALAGEKERAILTYRRVLAAAPGHLRALSALQNLLPRGAELDPSATGAPPATVPAPAPVTLTPEEAELEYLEPSPPSRVQPTRETASISRPSPADQLRRVFTLRSMIQAGRMEPRYSMRLWIQIMRLLAERHRANSFLEGLTPDAILIDMENNVRIESPAGRNVEYCSPELLAGCPPDRQSDIYSMGVILFELVTGSIGQLGKKRAGELFPDVPSWLDDLIERCLEINPARRYRTTEEISATLLELKNATQE